MTKRIPVPYLNGAYTNIYRPCADVYPSADTAHFRRGARYDEWIPNDFTVIRSPEDGCWHMIGITHPRPPREVFTDAFVHSGDIHEAEWQLFHAAAEGGPFRQVVRPGAFRDQPKILGTFDRPGERPEIWAPFVTRRPDGYRLIYSPGSIRQASSPDLYHWTPDKTPLFSEADPMARDINLFFEDDGLIRLVYLIGNTVVCRTSRDFAVWSEPQVIFHSPYRNADPESPFLIRREGIYYLFWCIYDGHNGVYDERTFVQAAERLEDLDGHAPVAMLPAHAPEVVESDGEYWILSAFYPENGVSAAPLAWR